MENKLIDNTSKIINSAIGKNALVREYCTIHDSTIGVGSRIYERVSLKKTKIGEKVDINSGTYIEFADIENDVQIGPNCSVVGIFHKLTKKGVERADTFNRIKIGKGAFLGAGTIILPGRSVGAGAVIGAGAIISRDVPPFYLVTGAVPNQTMSSLEDWIGQ